MNAVDIHKYKYGCIYAHICLINDHSHRSKSHVPIHHITLILSTFGNIASSRE